MGPSAVTDPSTLSDERHPAEQRAGWRRTWTLIVASVSSFLVALDLLVVTTALDTIRVDLDAPTSSLQWIVTAYSVTFASLLMTGAALGDRFGRRRVMLVGLAVFGVGSALAAMSTSVEMLVGARVVQGGGGAMILPLALTMVTSAFPADRRGSAIGVLEGVSGLAVIAGPVIGGVVAEVLSWQWIFWVNVPIAATAIVLFLVVVEETWGPDSALDVPGLVLVSTAACGVVWGLVRGGERGWTSGEILGAMSVGVVATAAFVLWEMRAKEPMLPMRFFRARSFSVGASASVLLSASLFAAVFFMAQFLQSALGYSSLEAGLRLLPWTGTLLLTAPLAGQLADRIGYRPVLATGLLIEGVGLGWLAWIAGPDLGYLAMVPPLMVSGFGCSAAIPVAQAAIVGSVTDAEIGKAAGANNMLQELGGAFGVAVSVATFSAVGGYGSATLFADGFRAAIATAAVLAALGFVLALMLPGRR